MNSKLDNHELVNNIKVSGFAYEMIRDELLSEILGNNYADILYFGGKRLAQKYNLQSFEEIADFFEKAGFGTLAINKERKNQTDFTLSGPLLQERIKAKNETTFQLESGFLAQSFENMNYCITESEIEINKKEGTVRFFVKWDPKDKTQS